ncbi:Voltage-gated Ion Channel (VIC) Superfamily [Achlya hypogyna]|uniref:Voltage-gated Ion Channel (VIC) Superfamily n=1 Tax=Achlya hypogyna TaxID=1202772 RepID=A0A1V9YNJ1_ACHHY|nr:Voltage-gated Ion Channel (VIC) Superfamily [Achlya hypogyna]
MTRLSLMDVHMMLPAKSARYVASHFRRPRRLAIQPRDHVYRAQLKQRMQVNDPQWQAAVESLRRLDSLKALYARQRLLENWIGFFTFVSIVVESAAMRLYLTAGTWPDGRPPQPTQAYLDLVKSLLTVLSILLLVLIYRRYEWECRIETASGKLSPGARFYHRTSGKLGLYLLESAAFAVHMLPRVDYTVSVAQYVSAATQNPTTFAYTCPSRLTLEEGHCYSPISYNVNQLGLVILVRVFVFGRLLRNVLGFNTNNVAFVGAIHNVNSVAPYFSVKFLFHVYPTIFASLALLGGLFMTAVAILQVEGYRRRIRAGPMWAIRAINPGLTTFGDSLWLTVVTMTTVGYGEVAPITTAGRCLCVVGGVFGGTVFNALLRAVFVDALGITIAEDDVIRTITSRDDGVRARHLAARLLQTAWRMRRSGAAHALDRQLHSALHAAGDATGKFAGAAGALELCAAGRNDGANRRIGPA